jgi:putative spermidine/putrescine transport system permease protein
VAAVGRQTAVARSHKRRLPSPLSIVCFLIYLFLLLPEVGVLFNAFNASPYVGAEFKGFTLRWFISAFQNVNYMDSLRISVMLALVTMALAIVAGTMASLGLARYRFHGWEVANAFLLAPLGVPHIALAIGILIVFHQIGLGSTLTGLVIAHVCITIPYVVRVVYAGLASLGHELEEAARNLGANLMVVLGRVTLPLIKGSLLSGAMLAFIVSFDEVTITLLIAGARTTTLPVRIFSGMSDSWDMAIMALSSLQILVTLVIVLALDRTVGLRRLAGAYAS